MPAGMPDQRATVPFQDPAMDMTSPHSGQPDDRAQDEMAGARRAGDAPPPEEDDARDPSQGVLITPRVELYSPPMKMSGKISGKMTGEMAGVIRGRHTSERVVAVDARTEAPPISPNRPSPLCHSVAIREDALHHDSLIGAHIAGFRIDRLICKRGLGAVYEGVQEWPPRSVAIKVSSLDGSPDMARRHGRRWEAVQPLNHPYIAAVHSSTIEPWGGLSVLFQVMEYVAGAIPLRRFVISRRLSPQQRLALFREVCVAVAHSHQQGVFHGYLTPQKVLLDTTGSVKVVDYCNLLAFGGHESMPPAIRSEPSRIDICYLSPEQYVLPASTIDARADVYSLGAMLYELLTGLPPYDVGSRSIAEAADLIRRTRPISPRKCNERVTPAMQTILGNCLKKNRSERLANAQELVWALDEVVSDGRPRIRSTHSRSLALPSRHGRAWTAFNAIARKAQPRFTALVQQIVSLARRNRIIPLSSPWPWIGLFLMGWLFLWIVAEIAREALTPHPVHIHERRSEANLVPPVQLPPTGP